MVIAHVGRIDLDVVVDRHVGHARRDVVRQVDIRAGQRVGVRVRVQRDTGPGQLRLDSVDGRVEIVRLFEVLPG